MVDAGIDTGFIEKHLFSHNAVSILDVARLQLRRFSRSQTGVEGHHDHGPIAGSMGRSWRIGRRAGDCDEFAATGLYPLFLEYRKELVFFDTIQ